MITKLYQFIEILLSVISPLINRVFILFIGIGTIREALQLSNATILSKINLVFPALVLMVLVPSFFYIAKLYVRKITTKNNIHNMEIFNIKTQINTLIFATFFYSILLWFILINSFYAFSCQVLFLIICWFIVSKLNNNKKLAIKFIIFLSFVIYLSIIVILPYKEFLNVEYIFIIIAISRIYGKFFEKTLYTFFSIKYDELEEF